MSQSGSALFILHMIKCVCRTVPGVACIAGRLRSPDSLSSTSPDIKVSLILIRRSYSKDTAGGVGTPWDRRLGLGEHHWSVAPVLAVGCLADGKMLKRERHREEQEWVELWNGRQGFFWLGHWPESTPEPGSPNHPKSKSTDSAAGHLARN